MKVLIASIAHFCDIQGGSQRIVDDEAAELRDRGIEVWVLAPGNETQPEHELRDGVHLLRYVPAKVAAWNPARRSAHRKGAARVLARHLPRVDAIHGHVPLSYLAALNVYESSVHTCYTIHSPARMEMAIVWRGAGRMRRLFAIAGLPVINRMERECLRRSKVITALSQFTIDCIARLHGKQLAGRIRLFPGWVDTARFVALDDATQAREKLGWPKGVPILFTLRRLSPRMGLDRLLDACGLLKARQIHVHLIVGGSGPLRMRLEEQAKANGLSDSVTFMGRIEDDMLPFAYGACDAFVLPTAELECFGLIAIEALAAGRPVLATPVGAIPEVVSRFEPAWLSRSASASDLADLLGEFLSGAMPVHSAAQLHDQADCEFGRGRLLPAFVDAALERTAQR